MAVTELTVPSMSCAMCEASVSAALGALEGVARVAVDLEPKTVTVQHAATVAPSELAVRTTSRPAGLPDAERNDR